MKVLWFSNTPARGDEYLHIKDTGGGWMKALDGELQNQVDLHVAFHYPKPINKFQYGKTKYYPITLKNWRLQLFYDNFTNRIYDREFEGVYLALVNEVKPDIIHIHGTENPFGCIIGKVKIPVVVSIQGNMTVYTKKFLSGIDAKYLRVKNIDTSKSIVNLLLSKSFSDTYKVFKRSAKIESRNLSDCKYIIGRTDWDRRITSILSPKSRYFHGDEMLRASFYENKWSSSKHHPDDQIIIHTTSGNSPYKGFESICSSLTLLIKLGYNIEWRVAGVKEKDLIVKIVKKKLNDQFPGNSLILLGDLDENQIVKKLLEADMYVMPSHIENSPNSLCEAMILGMPCIATFAGGTGSLLKDGEEGILIQEGDPWALSGAILELAKNREKACKYGLKARIKALQRHNKEKIIMELLIVYNNIVTENSIHNKL